MKNQIKNFMLCALLLLLSSTALLPADLAEESGKRAQTKYIVIGFYPGVSEGSAITASAVSDDVDSISAMGGTLRPLFSKSSADISRERRALAASAGTLPDLNRWALYRIETSENVEALIEAIKKLPMVQTAYEKPKAYPAVIETDTPRFTARQKYLKPSPKGVNAKFMWRKKTAGKGITVVDVEGDWNEDHEDLTSANSDNLFGVRREASNWYEHGTAEIGLVVGDKNSFGIHGIAYKADIQMQSIFQLDDNDVVIENTADAIVQAASRLKPGDVIYMPIEFRDSFTNHQGFAVEYYDDVFEAIQIATAKGIVVIEAAGNGGLNLDSDLFDGRFNVAKRGSSGAILVGAGGVHNYRNLEHLSFSNYGNRIDVQNWGTNVVTCGYGNLYSKGSDAKYTDSFDGTSSASGITAGICALIQNYAIDKLGRPLTPDEVRYVLVESGDEQLGNKKQFPIGPRPNLRQAAKLIRKMK